MSDAVLVRPGFIFYAVRLRRRLFAQILRAVYCTGVGSHKSLLSCLTSSCVLYRNNSCRLAVVAISPLCLLVAADTFPQFVRCSDVVVYTTVGTLVTTLFPLATHCTVPCNIVIKPNRDSRTTDG